MSTFQKSIEKIIKDNIRSLSGASKQKRSLHLTHQTIEMFNELYNKEPDAIAFLNHFGHIEYSNKSFSRLLMMDKTTTPIKSIFNLDQLNIQFDLQKDEVLHVTYPNGKVLHMKFSYQLVHLQKSSLLQLRFRDITVNYEKEYTQTLQANIARHYMKRLPVPMFLFNQNGTICHVPDNSLKLFGKPLGSLYHENIFEALPFDYANELMEKTRNITLITDGHFMYQQENDKFIKVYDTTVYMLEDHLYMCQVHDVSDLNTMSSTIEYLNSYDSLTGFHNNSFCESTLQGFSDFGHLPLGLFTLSINGLKQLNFRYSPHECDHLLIEVAIAMKALISQHEIPCRVSGDTFVIFFPNATEVTLTRFVRKMDEHIKTFLSKYYEYHLTYTEKHLLITDNATDLQALLKNILI